MYAHVDKLKQTALCNATTGNKLLNRDYIDRDYDQAEIFITKVSADFFNAPLRKHRPLRADYYTPPFSLRECQNKIKAPQHIINSQS